MKRRWKMLIAAGIFLVLVGASMTVTLHIQPANELEAYKKALRDKGEKLEISEVVPPRVPDESNGVALVESAFGLLPSSSDDLTNLPQAKQMIGPGKALVGWAQPDVRWFGHGGYSNSWETALAVLEADRPAMQLLKQAASFPALDFHPDYQSCYEIRLPHLEPLRYSARILSADAVCDLHKGSNASAVTNICEVLSLAQMESDERVLASQMTRLAMAAVASDASWEILQVTNLTDPQLARLQICWQQQEYLAGVEGAALMERAWLERLIQALRVSESEFSRLTGGTGGATPGFSRSGNWAEDARALATHVAERTVLKTWQKSWSFADEERMLRKNQITLEAIRSARTNRVFKPVFDKMDTQLATMGVTNPPGALLRVLGLRSEYLFTEGFSYTFTAGKFVQGETIKQMVVAAVALKRFQLKHGTFPENLSELVPEFLPAPPPDPMDGKPLRYRRDADGTFLLYSIGDDGVDGGGDTTPVKPSSSGISNWNWLRGRDWVWPQPATTEEMRMFYAEQAAEAAAKAALGPGFDPVTGLPVLLPDTTTK